VLRGSMNSVMGTVGLNVPLRAVERLTGAVEHAASMLERLEEGGVATRVLDLLKRADRITRSVERASRHLDDVEDGFVKRLSDALDMVVLMRQDTEAIRARLDTLELEVREVRSTVTQRLDRSPLFRPSRKERRATGTGAVEPE
jgi:hypothetical protein